MTDHAEQVRQQFDPQASAYLHSAVHAQGPDLDAARRLLQARLPPGARVLDVGCGAGHLSFALAPLAGSVVALDPAPGMLETVAGAAAQRGLHQVRTQAGSATRLPFDDRHFDAVATRYSAHHWPDLPAALQEMRRVLKPGGWLLVIDVMGADEPLVDTHLQAIELLRDASHVRNRDLAQWRALLAAEGFTLAHEARWPLRLQFTTWIERMRTPAAKAEVIRTLQREAPAEVKAALRIEGDGSFTATTGLLLAT
ncbi:methyltransferase domain-containing protein [Aquincola sp. MAHUQ-54]|uniref:Methyltransferase domain-containing protein n=1 Tax=Aquincola agrisoli TaxID=3119538 RepID=A0AAW9QH09_9BURK